MHRKFKGWFRLTMEAVRGTDKRRGASGAIGAVFALCTLALPCDGLEPPTKEQIENSRRDGAIDEQITIDREFGNHRLAPHLVERWERLKTGKESEGTWNPGHGLPSTGTNRIFALLIAFSDYPPGMNVSEVHDMLFGDGDPAHFPLESLRNYYLRSSFGKLDIQGNTLGWYTTPYPRSTVDPNGGYAALIQEALTHFDSIGHDFAQYDNDGNGEVDHFIVFWTGPTGDGWWSWYTMCGDSSFVLDGVTFNGCSWRNEDPDTIPVIHELGHSLGLPDYYDRNPLTGPPGGIGRSDIMSYYRGADHNCFSKYVLGWITPQVFNEGDNVIELLASARYPDAAILMHGDPVDGPFGEYFMIQNRLRDNNDLLMPSDGLLIWHVDARLDSSGQVLYDNSYTEHKLLRLMEADGLEEIETGDGIMDEGDYYTNENEFGTHTSPSSHRYDGAPTNLWVNSISLAGSPMTFQADLGSGCALLCDHEVGFVTETGTWTPFVAPTVEENCVGTSEFHWDFGDGITSNGGQYAVEHRYLQDGRYHWSVDVTQLDASCSRSGLIHACRDNRCWRWWKEEDPHQISIRESQVAVNLADERVFVAWHCSAEVFDPVSHSWEVVPGECDIGYGASLTLLDDGRVLAVCGNSSLPRPGATVFDPGDGSWTDTWTIDQRYNHSATRLTDGRVVVVGGSEGGTWQSLQSAEIFDPMTDTWTATADPPVYLRGHTATTLEDGRVLVVGDAETAFVFDPANEQWSTAGELYQPRTSHVAVLMADGRVFVAGGDSEGSAEIFDPLTNTWSTVAPMSTPRFEASGTLLSAGRILVAGGGVDKYFVGDRLDSVEIFDVASGEWTLAASMVGGTRLMHAAVPLLDGGVLLIGGDLEDFDLAPIERYGPQVALFADGFESADPMRWSNTVGE